VGHGVTLSALEILSVNGLVKWKGAQLTFVWQQVAFDTMFVICLFDFSRDSDLCT